MGSSYGAGYPAVTEPVHAGLPAVHIPAAELLHFRTKILGPRVVTRDGGAPAGATRVVIGSLARALAPAVSILPAQLLAWKLAILRGREPGTYVRASKVTTRE